MAYGPLGASVDYGQIGSRLADGSIAVATGNPVAFIAAGWGMLNDITAGSGKSPLQLLTVGEGHGCASSPTATTPDGQLWWLMPDDISGASRSWVDWTPSGAGRPNKPFDASNIAGDWPVGTKIWSEQAVCGDDSTRSVIFTVVAAPKPAEQRVPLAPKPAEQRVPLASQHKARVAQQVASGAQAGVSIAVAGAAVAAGIIWYRRRKR